MRFETCITKTFALFLICASTAGQTASIHAEAEQVAQEFWRQELTQCGNSYYHVGLSGTLIQYQDATFHVYQNQLSSADKMNGLQWYGGAQMMARLFRRREQNGWGMWKDGPKVSGAYEPVADITMEKSNGHWSIHRGGGISTLSFWVHESDPRHYPKPSCSSVSP